MEALAIHTGEPRVNQEYKTNCIPVVEAKIDTSRGKYIDIPVCFLQVKIDNGLFIPKYENSNNMPIDMCTKPFSGPIISWNT